MVRPTLRRERALWAVGRHYVAGVDEVGRGPIAGPVFAITRRWLTPSLPDHWRRRRRRATSSAGLSPLSRA